MADKTEPTTADPKPIIIPTGNDEPNPQKDNTNNDMEGMPTWAKEMKQSLDALTQALNPSPSPSKTPQQAMPPIPQPPPPPKVETPQQQQPAKKESAFARLGRFLL